MDADIKAKWVAALRSGKYMQIGGRLSDGAYGFCCLGVLCDIKGADGWGGYDATDEEDQSGRRYLGNTFLPNTEVREWAGFPRTGEVERAIPSVRIDGVTKALHDHNDDGKTFSQIAKAIEEQL